MLRILGSKKTLCDGLTRRDFLHVGGLGALGLGLADLFRLREAQAAAAARSFGRAKACILLFPYPPALETLPRAPRHWPFIGSVVDYIEGRRAGGAPPPVPRNVGLPWLLNSKTDLNVSAGPYAAFLGQGYDPVWADFDGPGTRIAPKYGESQKREFHDPFAATTAEGRFRLSPVGQLPGDVSVERLNLRRSLLA